MTQVVPLILGRMIYSAIINIRSTSRALHHVNYGAKIVTTSSPFHKASEEHLKSVTVSPTITKSPPPSPCPPKTTIQLRFERPDTYHPPPHQPDLPKGYRQEEGVNTTSPKPPRPRQPKARTSFQNAKDCAPSPSVPLQQIITTQTPWGVQQPARDFLEVARIQTGSKGVLDLGCKVFSGKDVHPSQS